MKTETPEFLRAKEIYASINSNRTLLDRGITEALESVFPELKQKDWRDITTIEQVCEIYCSELPYNMIGKVYQFEVCLAICMAINKGAKELDWKDRKISKISLYYNHKDSRLNIDVSNGYQNLPKEFYFGEREKAEHVIEHFRKYFEAFTKGGEPNVD